MTTLLEVNIHICHILLYPQMNFMQSGTIISSNRALILIICFFHSRLKVLIITCIKEKIILGGYLRHHSVTQYKRITEPSFIYVIIVFIFISSSGFRALIPGGGTDGGVSYLGEQLRNRNSETVYVDFSRRSMSVSQLRAKMRGILDIVWIVDWLESIPRLGMGLFDFIGCTGVLHHLKDPQKGLNTLGEFQSGKGGAMFMVYGHYGRSGIYQIQNLLQIAK